MSCSRLCPVRASTTAFDTYGIFPQLGLGRVVRWPNALVFGDVVSHLMCVCVWFNGELSMFCLDKRHCASEVHFESRLTDNDAIFVKFA